MVVFEWKRAGYLGTVGGGKPVVNLRGIIDEIGQDCYWDYDMEALGILDFDEYLAWRICLEVTEVVIHELTHIFTGCGDDDPTHEGWTGFMHKLLGFPP
jgi:hypothetical protein